MSKQVRQKKSNNYSAAEIDFRLRKTAMITQTISDLGCASCKWLSLAFMAFCAWQIAAALSGEQTNANIAFKAALDMHADRWMAYIFGGGGIIYGIRERRLRRKSTSHLQERVQSLENQISPTRTSSGLTRLGDTPREDRK